MTNAHPNRDGESGKSGESRESREVADQLRLVFVAVFLAYLGQMTLNPIIAPFAREVGLSETQVGLTISVAAIVVLVTSGMWGRRSQSWGPRPVLMLAFGLGVLIMTGFTVSAWLGMVGLVGSTTMFGLVMALRGVGFGIMMGAVGPTAQAYVTEVSPDSATRVKGMAAIGTAQGLAMISGAVLGGVLSGLGLLAPIAIIPVLLALGLGLVTVRMRRSLSHELVAAPSKLNPWDRRVWPFLLAGFGLFTALGFIQVITGFVIQDRFALTAETTGMVTGGALLVSGLGMLVSQAVIVPRARWAPGRLLLVGALITLGGFVAYIPDAGAVPLFIAMALIGVGIGIALPGYIAGPTLLVRREEQGGLAGLTNATSALTFVLAPTASSALYELWPPLPMIVGALILTLVAAFVASHPQIRQPAT